MTVTAKAMSQSTDPAALTTNKDAPLAEKAGTKNAADEYLCGTIKGSNHSPQRIPAKYLPPSPRDTKVFLRSIHTAA